MARGLIRGKGFVFEPNYDLGHDLRRSGVLDHALNQLAGEIALTAKEIAVREAFDTGDYMDSIHGRLATGRTGMVKGRHVLRRAARRSGLRVRNRRRQTGG
jgi:hypothetical protein